MDNDITGLLIAAIPGIMALVVAVLAMWERRQDKRSERIRKEKEAELETIKSHSANAIKEIADEITASWQDRVTKLESRVAELKKQVEELKEELVAAYKEIERLKVTSKKPPTRLE